MIDLIDEADARSVFIEVAGHNDSTSQAAVKLRIGTERATAIRVRASVMTS